MHHCRFGCMIVLAVFARKLVTARAFQRTILTTRRSAASITVVSSSVNGSKGKQENNFKPSTGWNHNLPGKDSSFWQGSSDSESNEELGEETAAGSKKELRTGWLHNTAAPKPKESAEAAAPPQTNEARVRLQQAMKEKERNHRIICPPAFHCCGGDRRIVLTEHKISLPVFREQPKSPRIDVFFTIVEEMKDEQWWKSLVTMDSSERAKAYVRKAAMKNADSMILYLQGGPGFGAPTPVVGLGLGNEASWAGKALSKFSRVVLMDQRGTGRSTPVTKQSLEKRFPELFLLDDQEGDQLKSVEDFDDSNVDKRKVKDAISKATDFLAQFRADNIVQDAEEIRDALLLPTKDKEPRPFGGCLGQSFGGFCIMTYLSQVAHPPRICLLTGGIGPMTTDAYDLYQSLWQTVKERNLRYYDMYPGDIPMVKKIVKKLIEKPATLPSGGKLTARRFLQQGLGLGGSPSAFASMHSLLSTAFLDSEADNLEFTRAFLRGMEHNAPFDDHPFYFLLHETIYCDGPKYSPTEWAAHRAYQDLVKTPSDFDYKLTSQLDSDTRPTLFFGEMVFPWMAEGDYMELSGLGMRSLANALANKKDWEPLYDGEHMRSVLQDGSITRAAAAVYYEDMYVDFDCCMKLTKRGGPLEKCKIWVTNDFQHSGLRDDGAAIFSKLYGMATGMTRTPS